MKGQRPTFDEAARARIREALERYRQEHGIGIPTLQARIVEFLTGDPKLTDRLPAKTIQRFLAGTHRTTDPTVQLFVRFLAAVAPLSAEETLAAPLANFLARPGADLAKFLGTWRTRLRPIAPQSVTPARRLPGQVHVVPLSAARADTPWSILTLTGVPGSGFLRAQERLDLSATPPLEGPFAEADEIDDPATEVATPPEATPERADDWLGNTGLLVPWGRGALVLLRSYIETRLYTIAPAGETGERLEGSVLQSPSLFDMPIPGLPEPALPAFQIIMSRA